MEPRRVIITGGSGLVGRHLAAELLSSGYEVVALSRQPSRVRGLPAGAQVAGYDPGIAQGALAVVNLAGENLSAGRWTASRKRRILNSRLWAGEFVTRAVSAAAARPKVVLQASGVNYYGLTGDREVVESCPPGDDFLARVCVDWEASTAAVEGLGVRRVITRSGVVLSAQGGALPRMLLPFRFFVGGRLGSGRQPFSWIHIADEVGAMRFLIENEAARGPFNLVAPQTLTNAEFSHEVGRAMGRPSLVPVPGFALRVLFGEMATVLLEGQRAASRRLQEAGYSFRFPDIHSALADLLR